ncbi:peptide-methionine (R)-S-oxide reductase MsrB [Tabrizicola fusiformis]|uniref:peptide-methionine (R)-S-oxide reductase MsrB n=1 Tax=Tabrizicola sp. SY72 TaxID=2741673 RepID=UPI001571BAE9|nr:peptide-methionine (R)-S-oxide reductase MsrB [Tabrizicola sp. SY72]NTT85395.1 peptide-methionine (R)-S-oxide reductase MsrB [Tabrizicola sp. SY72]
MHRRGFLWAGAAAVALGLPAVARGESFEVSLSDGDWLARLGPDRFGVLRQEATEPAGSSPLNHEKRAGTFLCAGCDLPLFSSTTKYDSGTGWPSFWEPLANAVATRPDPGLFGSRTEVHCRRCGGHLGHVFDDGPPPTGKRFCMNGLALTFRAG